MRLCGEFARISRPRLLFDVLADLKEARRDLDQALSDGDDDRATEADQRIDELRDEWDRKLRLCTGLSWREIETAVEEALI
jgi:phosphate uptake regulator